MLARIAADLVVLAHLGFGGTSGYQRLHLLLGNFARQRSLPA
jgi:hypothetical protein